MTLCLDNHIKAVHILYFYVVPILLGTCHRQAYVISVGGLHVEVPLAQDCGQSCGQLDKSLCLAAWLSIQSSMFLTSFKFPKCFSDISF